MRAFLHDPVTKETYRSFFFKEWLHEISNYFYANFSSVGLVNTWKGKRLLAIDCSSIRLPDTPETRAQYTRAQNCSHNCYPVLSMIG